MVHNTKLNIMHFSYMNEKSESLQQVVDCSSEEKKENLEFENDNLQHDTSDMLTLEGLKRQYYSCSNCGVSWYDDHISLDCSECGGYAMCRPCPECNGQCGSIWRRDVESSRTNKQAEWHGSCSLNFQWNSSDILESDKLTEDNTNFQNSYHCIHIASKPKTFIQETHIL